MNDQEYPMKWVTMKRLSRIRGESDNTIRFWVENAWDDGIQFKKISKGKKTALLFNCVEIDKWVDCQKSVA